MWLQAVGSGPFQVLSWLLGTYSPCWVALPSLNAEGEAWSYSPLLKPMGGLPVFEMRWRKSGYGHRREAGGILREREEIRRE